MFSMLFQLKVHIERETFVWWEVPTTGREEWRFSGEVDGELSMTLCGLLMMLVLSVGSYNMLQEVVCLGR